MRKSAAILFPFALDKIGGMLTGACARHGVSLTLHDTHTFDIKMWPVLENPILFWHRKLPHEWYEGHVRAGKNILFLENGLVGQKEGFLVDSRGHFNQTRLCQERLYDQPVTQDLLHRLRYITRGWFGWEPWSWERNNGPLLFACQQKGDNSVLNYFPGEGDPDTRIKALDVLRRSYSGDNVVIRPHPWGRGNEGVEMDLPATWRVEMPEEKVYGILPGCRGLVTVNSTLATEALALGMPVAVYGFGAFTGSGTVLECVDDHDLVNGIDSFVPDRDRVEQYLCACLRQQVSYNATIDTLALNQEFVKWIERME